MRARAKRIVLALAIGIAATAVLYGCGAFAYDSGHERLSRVLYWQGPALQALAPGFTVGSGDKTMVEATPVHIALFFAGLPLGVVLYGALTGAWLSVVSVAAAGVSLAQLLRDDTAA
jgi:hypothetical protein